MSTLISTKGSEGFSLLRLVQSIVGSLALVTFMLGLAFAGDDEKPSATAAANSAAAAPQSLCAASLMDKDTVIPAGITECRAYMAIYYDQKGRVMYFENVYNDPRRLIQTIPIYDSSQGGCIGGPKCFVCVGNRCGCVC